MQNSRGGLVLALFGIPFFLVGLWLTWSGIEPWLLRVQSRAWPETPVTLETLRLDQQRHKNSTSYRIHCTYSYTFAGQAYTSTRVGLESSALSRSRAERERYARLDAAWRAGARWTARVDPADPRRAVLFDEVSRDAYPAIPLGIFFGSIGLALVGFGLTLSFQALGERRRARLHPDRPWRIAGFEGRVLDAHSWRGLALGWAACVVFTLFAGLLGFMAIDDRRAPVWVQGLVGLFGLAALAWIGVMARETLAALRYGSPRLVLRELPIRPGELLAAELEVDGAIPAPALALALKCVRAVRRGKSVHYETVRELTASAPVSPGGRRVAIHLAVPAELPPRSESDRVHWELHATAAGFSARFTDLPVYPAEPALVER